MWIGEDIEVVFGYCVVSLLHCLIVALFHCCVVALLRCLIVALLHCCIVDFVLLRYEASLPDIGHFRILVIGHF